MKLNKIILAMLTSASLLAAAGVHAEDDPTPRISTTPKGPRAACDALRR